MQKAAIWPCGVYGRGVGSNSIQCTSCEKWVHKNYSDIKGSISKVMKSFIFRGCLGRGREVVQKNCQARKLNRDVQWIVVDGRPG